MLWQKSKGNQGSILQMESCKENGKQLVTSWDYLARTEQSNEFPKTGREKQPLLCLHRAASYLSLSYYDPQ